MNIERINKLIDHLREVPKDSFKMDTWFMKGDYVFNDHDVRTNEEVFEESPDLQKKIKNGHWCGTSGCIAGHAFILAVIEGFTTHDSEAYFDSGRAEFIGRVYLELTNAQSSALFTPNRWFHFDLDYGKVTREDAIKALEHFRDTGDVTWDHLPENYFNDHEGDY